MVLALEQEIQPTPVVPDRNTGQQTTALHRDILDETKAPTSSAKVSRSRKPVVIAIMGATGTGKTTFINLASGSDLRIGRGLESCTDMINVAQPFELNGRMVALVDTPGFDDTTKSDADVLTMIGQFLATTYEQGQRLAGVVYMHRISDFRMTGISTRNFKMFRALCGDETLKNVVIVTNMWGEVSKEVGVARESELASNEKFFKPALGKRAQMLRHDNNAESAKKILRTIINNHPLPLQAQIEMVDEKKDISQTAAGAELHRELLLQREKHEKEMKEIREEMQAAIQAKDEETRQELEEASKGLQKSIDQLQADTAKLVSIHTEEKAEMQRRLRQLADTYRDEADRRQNDFGSQAAALRRSLDDAAAERGRLEREITDLRNRPRQRSSSSCIIY